MRRHRAAAQIVAEAEAAGDDDRVEAVEALTVVLAVGLARGWRPALTGAAAALAALALIVAILGPLMSVVPIRALQFVVGVLTLLFGLRWLRKAVLRAAGDIALHDEDALFRAGTAKLQGEMQKRRTRADWLAAVTAFFVELGLKLQGEGPVEGSWVDRVVGLEGVRAEIAMVECR